MTSAGLLAPILSVARSGVARRQRSALVLGALVAATVAFALASLTAAARAESAFDRLRADSHSSDLVFFGERDLADAIDRISRIDGLAEVGVTSEMFVRPLGSELIPDHQLIAMAARSDLGGAGLDTPRIVAGRSARPEDVDEVVLSEALAADLGVHVGDMIDLESFSNAWVDIAFNGGDPGPPDGPVVSAQLVGLSSTPADFGRFAGRIVHLTPAFAARFEDRIRTYTWVSARAADPSPSGLEELTAGPLRDMEVDESFFADSEATQDGLRTVAVSLRLVASAGAVAGVTAVGLAAGRLARDVLTCRNSLVAIGCTRAQLVLLVSLALVPWVMGGLVLGLVLGSIMAPRAAVGLARAVDPDLGVIANTMSIALVAIGSAAILGALVGLVAVRAARPPRATPGFGIALPPLDHPLAILIAVRRTIFGASDRGGRAGRGATLALASAIMVAVAALVVSASIAQLQDDPSLSGHGTAEQRAIDSGESLEDYEEAMRVLEADDRVADLAGAHIGFATAAGVGDLAVLVLDARRGDLGGRVVSGRLPSQPDEVAMGPATLEAFGGVVGDDVELGSDGATARFRIVGVVLFPEGDFPHDWGSMITVGGADRFLGGVNGTEVHQTLFIWAPGVDAMMADRALEDRGLPVFSTAEGLQPAVVSNLGQVRNLPLALGVLVIAARARDPSPCVGRDLAAVRWGGEDAAGPGTGTASHRIDGGEPKLHRGAHRFGGGHATRPDPGSTCVGAHRAAGPRHRGRNLPVDRRGVGSARGGLEQRDPRRTRRSALDAPTAGSRRPPHRVTIARLHDATCELSEARVPGPATIEVRRRARRGLSSRD